MTGEQGGSSDAAIRAALDTASVGLPDVPAVEDAELDVASLELGLRVGLERPAEARRLLTLLAQDPARGPAAEPAGEDEPPPDGIPVRSRLLVRAATLPVEDAAGAPPDVLFGWAGRLTRDEIPQLGREVQAMIDGGASQDLGRGFGIAWDGGVHLPHRDLEVMFAEFRELQFTVCSVLAGRDLRAIPDQAAPGKVASWFTAWIPRPSASDREADAVLEGAGKPGQLGLVALWNTWTAVRYRAAMPAALFEQLTRPWVTVVGPLPAD